MKELFEILADAIKPDDKLCCGQQMEIIEYIGHTVYDKSGSSNGGSIVKDVTEGELRKRMRDRRNRMREWDWNNGEYKQSF